MKELFLLINKDGIHQLIIVLGKISISYLSTADKYMKIFQISFDNQIFLWRGNLMKRGSLMAEIIRKTSDLWVMRQFLKEEIG